MTDSLDDKIKQVLNQMGISEAYKPTGELEKFYKLQDKKVPIKTVHSYNLTPDEGNAIHIVPLFDVHAGHRASDLGLFQSYVDYILNTPDTYTVLGGDLHESATAISIGMGMQEEEDHLAGQRDYLQRVLEPLAREGKILLGIPGNHEQRVSNFNGDCPMRELCRDLGVPYAGYQAYLRLRVGDQKYDIVVFHGNGGGRTKGAKINAAIRPNEVALVDMYLTGHSHDRGYTEDAIYFINDKDELERHRRVYVICGSFLNYFGSYPEMKGLAPSIAGGVRIDLMKDAKRIHVYY